MFILHRKRKNKIKLYFRSRWEKNTSYLEIDIVLIGAERVTSLDISDRLAGLIGYIKYQINRYAKIK